MELKELIRIKPGFQYSVNIGYDLNDERKIRGFIPTASTNALLKELLLSALGDSSDRSRLLIGPYGKGKSHLTLIALSILMKKEKALFSNFYRDGKTDPELTHLIDSYYLSENKILPIVITGSGVNLAQNFLLALQRALSTEDLQELMPETSISAALKTILKWKEEFPETYRKFLKRVDLTETEVVNGLKQYNTDIFNEFVKVYPELTSGSIFNPFVGMDVPELYEEAAKALKKKSYSGLYIVYDEFSKYLEANASGTSVNDMKMLQDLAERCNRSGPLQLHLMLISHKDIENYMGKLPKEKIDGWRGVANRFKHEYLTNHYNTTYEIIETVILRDGSFWPSFCNQFSDQFEALFDKYSHSLLFSDLSSSEIYDLVYNCFPMHPVTSYILPRLSEKVAQNERTLFTFLASKELNSLYQFINDHHESPYSLITPDLLYDYFEPLLKKELYSSKIHDIYTLSTVILDRLKGNELEQKLIKTLSLIEVLEQFERLKPTREMLVDIFSFRYLSEEILKAIDALIDKELVVYQKFSNGFLQMKKRSGINVLKRLEDVAEKQKKLVTLNKVLCDLNKERYFYPSRYNDQHEMMRYFGVKYLEADQAVDPEILKKLELEAQVDGFIVCVVPSVDTSLEKLKDQLMTISADFPRYIFITPKVLKEIEPSARRLRAITDLKRQYHSDDTVLSELAVMEEDLRELFSAFEANYVHPEFHNSYYISNGELRSLNRKSAFSNLLSDVCDQTYSRTPVINNEALNRNRATGAARNNRNKVIAGLLRKNLEPALGLRGSGQDVSIMRSLLIRTGLLQNAEENPYLDLNPANKEMAGFLQEIESFVQSATNTESSSFSKLYDKLILPENGIGVRTELIPVYLAAVLHEYMDEIIIQDFYGELPLTVDTLLMIHSNPNNYILTRVSWTSDQKDLIREIEEAFNDFKLIGDKTDSSLGYLNEILHRWYFSLPEFVKTTKYTPDGQLVPKEYKAFLNVTRNGSSGTKLISEELPTIFGRSIKLDEVALKIRKIRQFYDQYIIEFEKVKSLQIKESFLPANSKSLDASSACNSNGIPLVSVLREWSNRLNPNVFNQVFNDGTTRFLNLIKNSENESDEQFIARLAKCTSDLPIETWSDKISSTFLPTLQIFKRSAEVYHSNPISEQASLTDNDEDVSSTSSYRIRLFDKKGNPAIKQFEQVELSGRSKLLFNRLLSDLDTFGNTLSDAEKRQVIMDVLRELC